jgi:thymidine kinase
MFSGKSEDLIRRVRRALIAQRRVQVFKSALDNRYAGVRTISSHDGSGVEAVPVRSSTEVAEHVHPYTQVVAIDKTQFLDDGIDANYFLLAFARELDAVIVSNDLFRDRADSFPEARERMIRYMIVDEQVVFERRNKKR